jgi:hypothetical protein
MRSHFPLAGERMSLRCDVVQSVVQRQAAMIRASTNLDDVSDNDLEPPRRVHIEDGRVGEVCLTR